MEPDLFDELGIDPSKYQQSQRNGGALDDGVDLFEELGIDPNEYREKPWYKSIGEHLGAAGTGVTTARDELMHGAMQPLLESGYLGDRIKRGSQQVAEERGREYEQAKEGHPISSMIGKGIGYAGMAVPAAALSALASASIPAVGTALAGSRYIPGGAKLAESISSLASSMGPKAPGFMRYIGEILRSKPVAGGLTGGLGGAMQYVSPGESRGMNSLVGGGLGSTLGAAGTAISGAKGLASAYMKTHPAEKFAETFLKNMKTVENQYSKGYGDFLSKAKNVDGGKIEIPKINSKDILENSAKKENKYLRKLLDKTSENSNIETAHKAQSELGKLTSRLKSKTNKTHSELDTLNAAEKAQQKIIKAISKALETKGQSGLSQEYKSLTKGYAKDVIPYKLSKPVGAINKKRPDLTPEDFRSAIMKDKKFKAHMGKELYPELYKLPQIGKLGAGIGIGLMGHKIPQYLGSSGE